MDGATVTITCRGGGRPCFRKARRARLPRFLARPPLIVLFLLAASALPRIARADGGLLPGPWADVWEPAQRAILLFDPEAGREDLILQAGYEGTTDTLAWIVPVPALPTLTPADAALFTECAGLTKTVVQDRGFGCASGDTRPMGAYADQVDVYVQQQVGTYRTMIVGASNAAALADSLATWGFLHERNRSAVTAALQFYIDKSWFFVAMRTDPASVDQTGIRGYRSGGLEPIRLAFAASVPVYPMRISAISARPDTQVLLYVCAPHRMTFRGAGTEYANQINARELAHLRELYPALGSVITRPCFLTKLRWYAGPEDMNEDLVLVQAPRDEEFRQIHYAGFPAPEAIVIGLGLAAYTLWSLRHRRRGCSR